MWYHKWKEGGAPALHRRSPGGPRPKLSPQQLQQWEHELLKGPRHHGYKTQLGTLQRITRLIKRLFGVSYHPGHVFKILRAMGWSCQQPARQAREREEAGIDKCKRLGLDCSCRCSPARLPANRWGLSWGSCAVISGARLCCWGTDCRPTAAARPRRRWRRTARG